MITEKAVANTRPEDLVQELEEQIGRGVLGFARGRLDDGLETIIEDYLTIKDHHGNAPETDSTRAREKLWRLTNALVRFSKKVLDIANNDTLFRGPETVGDGPEVSARERRQSVRPYTLVLQAIGNAILAAGDELFQRDAFRRNSVARRDSEWDALRTAGRGRTGLAYLIALREVFQERENAAPANDPTTKATAAAARILLENALNDGEFLTEIADLSAAQTLAAILAKVDKIDAANRTPDHAAARRALLAFGAPSALPAAGLTAPGEKTTAKGVFDQVLPMLRHEHLQAVRQFGANSPAAQRLEAAIKAAYQQRAGFAYLRPAAAFLRTVMTASGLQNNTPLNWRNNLRRHQFRGVWPFSDTTESAADLAAADIDKQFWQNINRVRVAGGGTTNYVMAKDDIGNWYVKSYETDVDDIINSTVGLAKFALGARLGTDFLNTRTARRQRIAAALNAPSTAIASAITKRHAPTTA